MRTHISGRITTEWLRMKTERRRNKQIVFHKIRTIKNRVFILRIRFFSCWLVSILLILLLKHIRALYLNFRSFILVFRTFFPFLFTYFACKQNRRSGQFRLQISVLVQHRSEKSHQNIVLKLIWR